MVGLDFSVDFWRSIQVMKIDTDSHSEKAQTTRFRVHDERLGGQVLELDPGRLFFDPALYLDGVWLPVMAGGCTLKSVTGEDLPVSFRKPWLDRYPIVVIGRREHRFFPPLSIVHKILLGLPFVLFLGGWFGILVSMSLWLLNSRLFRSALPRMQQYLRGVLNIVMGVGFLIVLWMFFGLSGYVI